MKFKKKWKVIKNNFDWDKVQDVMEYLNWEWEDQIPTMKQLKQHSKRILKDAYKKNTIISSGGFEAEYIKDEDYLDLKFVLDKWDS